MALRDQPYLPLYVQDVLTDEKLIECSAESHGVYFRLLCILHKQEEYGVVCLKQKYKQTDKQIFNFASMFAKQMPFSVEQIAKSLEELIEEKVIFIEDDLLFQKRMRRDGQLSLTRASCGKTGGSSVTKQYGKSGFLYIMSDGYTKTKIGISINPENRLYRIRSDNKLPKHFIIRDTISVTDMGKSEDFAHDYFRDILDGEWLIGNFEDIFHKFVLLKANIQANAESNTEYESVYKNEVKDISLNNEKKDFQNFENKKPSGVILTFEECISELKSMQRTTQFLNVNRIPADKHDFVIDYFYQLKVTEKEGFQELKEVERHFKNWIKDNAQKIIKNQLEANNNNNNSTKPKKLNHL